MHATLKELDALHARARAIRSLGDGDRVPLYITGDMTFVAGQNRAAPITFNVPAGEDFFATRLNLFLGARLLSIASPDTTASDNVYRPADWTGTNDLIDPTGAEDSGQFQNKYATAFFAIQNAQGKKFQNAPMAVLHAFSNREPLSRGSIIGTGVPPALPLFLLDGYSAYVGGMDFDVEERIPAASSWTVTVTPTFARDVSADSDFRVQFRVRGVLTGHKKVRYVW
jgi:hypothetical protein